MLLCMSGSYTERILYGSWGSLLPSFVFLSNEMKKEVEKKEEREKGGGREGGCRRRERSRFSGGGCTPVWTGSAASCCFSRTSHMRTAPSSEHEINCLSEQKPERKGQRTQEAKRSGPQGGNHHGPSSDWNQLWRGQAGHHRLAWLTV